MKKEKFNIRIYRQGIITCCLMLLGLNHCLAQVMMPSKESDSVLIGNSLSEVVVNAYEQSKKNTDRPAAVFYLSHRALNRFDHTDIVSAVSAIPGVRMQQRSPQSYRLDIRGSALRSPFGVRNVKIYYNGIPLTDPGGNTYLNELGFEDIHDLSVIKGPAGSLYGAGTGGVVLINGPLLSGDSALSNQAVLNLETGGYGLQKIGAGVRWKNNEIRYTDLKQDGYRDQTAMHSRIASYETILKNNGRQQLSLTAHYADVYYQTPGALTKAEFDNNAKAARPASGIYPSSENNKAAVHQKNFLIGMNERYHFNDHLQANAVLYGAYTDFVNPTIRNYEFRKEPHFGGRFVLRERQWMGKTLATFWVGGEMQQGFFNVTDHENRGGAPDAMMNDDNIDNNTSLLFAQVDFSLPKGWDVTAAAGYHRASVKFKRLFPSPVKSFSTTYDRAFSPRLALSKKLNDDRIIYLNMSSGFSPPTISELLPSTSVINTSLDAERGINYEAGSRGFLWNKKLYYDVDAFVFNLKKSIALRRDSSGADYFVNAGGTVQHGIEAYFAYNIINRSIYKLMAWTSGSWFNFSYKDYQVAGKDYSENKLPGVAPFSLVAGLDFEIDSSFSAHLTYMYGHKIPLNDANDVFSLPYHLVNCSVKYDYKITPRIKLNIFAGVNNLLNEEYSLGDDINAKGGRYFNAAPGINFYLGLGLKYYL